MATVIACQAVISGAFSVTQQAIQLGFMPRLRIEHTSASAAGQIYIPSINWALMMMVILLVLGLPHLVQPRRGLWHRGDRRDADRHLPAGGRAVLAVEVEPRSLRGCRCSRSSCSVDVAYFAANLTKVPDGGWFPLLIGFIVFTLLTTWAQGPRS